MTSRAFGELAGLAASTAHTPAPATRGSSLGDPTPSEPSTNYVSVSASNACEQVLGSLLRLRRETRGRFGKGSSTRFDAGHYVLRDARKPLGCDDPAALPPLVMKRLNVMASACGLPFRSGIGRRWSCRVRYDGPTRHRLPGMGDFSEGSSRASSQNCLHAHRSSGASHERREASRSINRDELPTRDT